MIITRVVKKDDTNVIVYLDNNEKLYLSYEVFLRNGLRKNLEIPDGHFDILIKENQRHFVKQKALSYISRRHHSVAEVRRKLFQKKYDKEIIEPVLQELVEKGLLNDTEFAEIFTEENIRLKLWGKNKIKSELIKRGVAQEIIAKVLLEKFQPEVNYDNALLLAEKKLRLLKNRGLDQNKLKQKLFAFLGSRGYDYGTIKETVDKIIIDSDEEWNTD
jgi:regulatory protein